MSFFGSKRKNEEPIEVIEGYCPNCWGTQEYQNQIVDAAKKDNIDLNNICVKKGWIQAYAAQHLTGLRVQSNANKSGCLNCSI